MLLNRKVAASFTALIRWRGPDPAVEIETRHAGFSTPEEAALFANAFSPTAPLGLRIRSDGSLHFLLSDGSYVNFLGGEITLWRLHLETTQVTDLLVANDTDFRLHPFSEIQWLRSAHGDYEQAQYAVLAQDGSSVDVLVDWDEGDHLRVTVQEEVPSADVIPLFALGGLPRA